MHEESACQENANNIRRQSSRQRKGGIQSQSERRKTLLAPRKGGGVWDASYIVQIRQ